MKAGKESSAHSLQGFPSMSGALVHNNNLKSRVTPFTAMQSANYLSKEMTETETETIHAKPVLAIKRQSEQVETKRMAKTFEVAGGPAEAQ